jgi:hypothetical protein
LQRLAFWRYQPANFCNCVESCGHRALGIILVRLRPTKESLDFVIRSGGNLSAHPGNCGNCRVLEIPGDQAQVFRIDLNGERHSTHELAT